MSVSRQSLPGDVWAVNVRGRLDQNLNPQLEETLNDLLSESHYHLVVNLTDATYINSGGLRALVGAWRRARQEGGDLVLCGLNTRLQEIFSLVGFDKVFRIYATCEEARQHSQTT
jgi:anti-sigma B factor antagonist